MAEDAASELPNLSLQDALQLVHLYAERGSPKFEPAARRWLIRYLSEGTPGLEDVAKVTDRLGCAYEGAACAPSFMVGVSPFELAQHRPGTTQAARPSVEGIHTGVSIRREMVRS